MAEIIGRPTVQLTVTFGLTEEEARAFDALVGYGVEPFLKVFYEHMGKAYLQPHEDGLRSLFKAVRDTVPGLLGKAATARKSFHKSKVADAGEEPL